MEATKATKISTSRLVQTSICASLLVVGKLVLSSLANVEIVTTLVFCFAVLFGFFVCATAVNIFCIFDILIYSFNISVAVSYFVYFNLMCAAACLIYRFTKSKDTLPYLICACLFTISFGFITTFFDTVFFEYLFLPRYLSGIPFYMMHLLSTTVFMVAGFKKITSLNVK